MRVSINWGTHLPVLIKLLSVTNGPVLELGMGLYSTPFLHWACYDKKRPLVSYDSDEKYFHMNEEYRSDFHEVSLVSDWDKIIIEKPWDVVLVDCHPDTKRKELAMRLKNHAKFIVLHDSYWKDDYAYHYKEIYPSFKYKFDHTALRRTPTTVISNFVNVSEVMK